MRTPHWAALVGDVLGPSSWMWDELEEGLEHSQEEGRLHSVTQGPGTRRSSGRVDGKI